MSMLNDLNLNLIISTSDKNLSHRAFKITSKYPYYTLHEYDFKLRDAVLKIHLKIDAGKSVAKADATNKEGSLKIFSETTISNPFQCNEIIQKVWKEICILDSSKIGNLDDARYFDYLDWIFYLSHTLRKWELERGMLFPYARLNDWAYEISLHNKPQFACDPSVASKDVCKFLGEQKILARYMKDSDKKTGVIDDAIYLSGRILVESPYDGIADFKSRRY